MATSDPTLAVFLTYRARLVDYAAPIVGCRSWAEDVVQEAYLRFAQVSTEQSKSLSIRVPASYLYRIVRNLAMDWARHLAPQRPHTTDAGTLDSLPAAISSPEHDAVYRQQLRVVAEALGELPDRTRTAFEMHRLGGYTLQNVAIELGISVTLAHQLIHQALAHCADRLGEDE
jgi:RNA polymerase sigma factor (sigma-70 family)